MYNTHPISALKRSVYLPKTATSKRITLRNRRRPYNCSASAQSAMDDNSTQTDPWHVRL